jgi:hypothetical protein
VPVVEARRSNSEDKKEKLFMPSLKFTRALLVSALLITTSLFAASPQVFAQNEGTSQNTAKAKAEDTTAIEVQLHLIIGTNAAGGNEEKLPSSLDAVVKQLRSTFTFKNYHLAETSLNRVRNGGRLSLRWVGGPLPEPPSATPATPGFNEFRVAQVKLIQDEAGRNAIQMIDFNYGTRIPIQVSSIASNGNNAPVFQYEPTGITTDITVREGEPTIVGTLNIGTTGDALIVVVTAKRPQSK